MSYLENDDINLLLDISSRKEFYALKDVNKFERHESIIPLFVTEREMAKGNNLELYSYQKFVKNYINPNTPYKRLYMKHSTGSGKTIGAISIAMNFIKYFRKQELSGADVDNIGSIYIVSFDGPRMAFYKDLLRFTEFGFVSKKDLNKLEKLRQNASSGIENDLSELKDFWNRLKRRLTNRKRNGFFKFIGYKALVNRLFISDRQLYTLTKLDILNGLKDKSIKINKDYLNGFKNSLLICDEIHNIYNSMQKNNWGVAIQLIIDSVPSLRAVFMSATPINNNPREIVDLVNLLLPLENRLNKKNLFDAKNNLTKKGEDILRNSIYGKVSYLVDVNPKLFPSWKFCGSSINSIPYLKFIRCEMTNHHKAEYKKILNDNNNIISNKDKAILDFILPGSKKGEYYYRNSDIRKIQLESLEWKKRNSLDVIDDAITGDFLHISTLKNISPKYHQMMLDIFNNLKCNNGKMMIYHNYVHMSGVLFIKEILLKNGIIDENTAISNSTLCSLCGKEFKLHNEDSGKHKFKPARFLIIHSELRQSSTSIIDKFNRKSNSNGEEFCILLGSRILKESYDLKSVRQVMVVSRPDNISTLKQIIGRAVRSNSHIYLPIDKRNVKVSIYVHTINKSKTSIDSLSLEEVRYKDKVIEYKTIQNIEKILHENAIDSYINYNTIKPSIVDNTIGDLNYLPSTLNPDKPIKDYITSTFDAFYKKEEIGLVRYIIKRAFVEVSQVWKLDDLIDFINNPTFDVNYNTKLIEESSIIVALDELLFSKEYESYRKKQQKDISINKLIVDNLFDQVDTKIIRADGNVSVIKQYGNYYMLLPFSDNILNDNVDVVYRNTTPKGNINIDIREYLENSSIEFDYDNKKIEFKKKYESVDLNELTEAICDYGIDFHIKFIEEIIEYIFNTWTDWRTDRHEYHEFYFKMLYYYELTGFIIFADTTKKYIYDLYSEYLLPRQYNKNSDVNVNDILKNVNTDNVDKTNLLNLISRNIAKNTCDTCPQLTKDIYNTNLNKSLERFSKIQNIPGKKNKINKINPDMLPIGHYLESIPKFYHPKKGWFLSPEYLHDKNKWVENPIIIGYNVKSKTGIHIRFKLRNPVQNIKKFDDARLVEKGSICITRSKQDLLNIAKKIDLEIDKNTSIENICLEIKNKIMLLELKERAKGSNVKFFYNHFEMSSN